MHFRPSQLHLETGIVRFVLTLASVFAWLAFQSSGAPLLAAPNLPQASSPTATVTASSVPTDTSTLTATIRATPALPTATVGVTGTNAATATLALSATIAPAMTPTPLPTTTLAPLTASVVPPTGTPTLAPTATPLPTTTTAPLSGTVAGSALLTGRKDAAGAVVAAQSGAAATTARNGAWSLTLPPGVYTLTISYRGYLPAQRAGVVVAAGQTVTLPGVALAPGDVNGDGAIDAADSAALGADFGKTVGFAPTADLNGDGVVNIFDLVLLVGQIGKRGAQVW